MTNRNLSGKLWVRNHLCFNSNRRNIFHLYLNILIYIVGPCLFGGCSEFCCDFEFLVSKYDSDNNGDLAKITKVRAKGMAGMLKEAATDADNYSIQFNQDAQLGAPEKLSIIGAQVLTDYMIFDGNTEKCKCTNDGNKTDYYGVVAYSWSIGGVLIYHMTFLYSRFVHLLLLLFHDWQSVSMLHLYSQAPVAVVCCSTFPVLSLFCWFSRTELLKVLESIVYKSIQYIHCCLNIINY
jgi:hypothetical protein